MWLRERAQKYSLYCVTKRCKTLSGHNVVEGKDLKCVCVVCTSLWCKTRVI